MARLSAVQIRGTRELKAKLTRMANRSRAETRMSVEVGYRAPYAMAVHEKVEMKLRGLPRPSGIGVYWGPHGKAKFLEEPANDNREAIAARIAQVTKSTHSVSRGLYSGGVLLRQLSLYHVPVEYGVLRASVYIEVTKR